VCALDAIRCGTTALIDHHASPTFISGSLSTLRRGFERVGVRASTCYEVTDRHGRAEMSAGVEENARFAEELAGSAPTDGSPPLVASHIGGHAPFTLPEEGLRALATAAEATDRGVHIHAGEDAFDVSHSHLHYGEDLIERLDRHGLITDKTIVVHGVYLSEADVRLINERGAFLVSNARSNMNNGVGYNPHLPRYANLALGTDGIDGNMFHEIKHAYFKHRDARGAMSPQDFLSALQAGNRLLERSFGGSFGRIAPGYAADLVIADYNPPTPLGAENLAGHVVFGMDSGATRTVIVGGRIVYEDGRFPFDTAEIYADARLEAEKLWKRVDEIQP
jgi:putative selenium metabolism protein SsnA